jgi:hypothetical protein
MNACRLASVSNNAFELLISMKTKSLAVIVIAAWGLSPLGLSNAVAQDTQVYDDAGASSRKTKKNPNEKEPAGSKVVSFGGIEKAKEISKQEAAQKYPPRRGGYPTAETTQGPNTGMSTTILTSPYPPHHKFDTSAINRGALILDPYAKHVFIKP